MIVLYDGAPLEPVKFARIVFAAAFERANVRAGVVVAFETEVVKSGERLPALKLVTVPETELLVPQLQA